MIFIPKGRKIPLSVCHIGNRDYSQTGQSIIRQNTKGLASLGVNVSVISRKRDPKKKPQLLDGIRVYHIKTSQLLSSTLLQYSIKLLKIPEKFDILHFYDPRLPLTGVLKQLNVKKTKIIFDIRTVPVVPWGFSATHLGKCLYYSISSRISEGMIFINDLVEKYFSEHFNITPKLATIVPTGVNLEKFSPMNSSNLRKKYGIEDKFVFGYAGSITYQRQLHILIRAFATDTIEKREPETGVIIKSLSK